MSEQDSLAPSPKWFSVGVWYFPVEETRECRIASATVRAMTKEQAIEKVEKLYDNREKCSHDPATRLHCFHGGKPFMLWFIFAFPIPEEFAKKLESDYLERHLPEKASQGKEAGAIIFQFPEILKKKDR